MVEPFFFVPAFFFLISIAGLVLTVYVLYDVLFQQAQMETAEKLIWIVVVLVFNIVGVLIYLIMVKYLEENPFAGIVTQSTEKERLQQLERLTELKKQGALTEAEFQEEKQRVLNQTGSAATAGTADTAEAEQRSADDTEDGNTENGDVPHAADTDDTDNTADDTAQDDVSTGNGTQ